MENRWEERKKHLDKTERGVVIKGGGEEFNREGGAE